jgi:hypothetical protein
MPDARKNIRTLDEIADEIHKLDRTNIFDKGELLLEAKEQCKAEREKWLDWLAREFGEWSHDSATKYMRVAELGSQFRNLRNLRLAKTTLYELAAHEPETYFPIIINELSKHASKKRL